jgi:hypothetical protein
MVKKTNATSEDKKNTINKMKLIDFVHEQRCYTISVIENANGMMRKTSYRKESQKS